MAEGNRINNIVLVHGAFVDGSGWEAVYHILKNDGYKVGISQHPTRTLGEDVAYAKRVIAEQDGPVVLVGHSYGGVIITEAGTDPNVEALVYIDAFAPDKGESVASIIANPPPDAPMPPLVPKDGFVLLDKSKFHEAFAADVPADKAALMADAQTPWGTEAVGGVVTEPAWKSKQSWYLVGTEDRMIPAPAQRQMAQRAGATIVEASGSHSIFVSQPQKVADLIKQASQGKKAAVQAS